MHRKLRTGLITLVLALTAACQTPSTPQSESERLNAFFEKAFEENLALSPQRMTALGLKRVEGRAGDVTLRYLAVRSTSVDLDKLEALTKQGGDKSGADVTVGRLIVVMEDKASRRLWAADGVERLNPAVADRDQTIKGIVARMFETYPTRQPKK